MAKHTRIEDILKRGVKHIPVRDPLFPPLPQRGDQGPSGKDGAKGADGKAGADGRDGRDGRDGQDGVGFSWRGHWIEGQQYYKNDVVNYLGSSYIALDDNINDYPNRVNNTWDLVAASGAQGAKGRDGTDLRDTPHVGVPTFIQGETPDYEGSYVWVQTGLGDSGCDYTVWYNICEE